MDDKRLQEIEAESRVGLDAETAIVYLAEVLAEVRRYRTKEAAAELADVKERIMNYFRAGDVVTYSAVAEHVCADLEVIVKACDELVAEGVLRA